MTSQLDKTTLTKRFSELTEGNWRNSFYIDCSTCLYERPEGCGDFLFVPDETGRPFLYPMSISAEQLGPIDWSECLGRMSNFMFRELYHRWLNTRTLERNCCPHVSAWIFRAQHRLLQDQTLLKLVS